MILGIHYFITKLKTKIDVIPRGCFNVRFVFCCCLASTLQVTWYSLRPSEIALSWMCSLFPRIRSCGSLVTLSVWHRLYYLLMSWTHIKHLSYLAGRNERCPLMFVNGFKSRPGVIRVVHLQCSKLFKCLESAMLSMVLCTIRTP